jgi:hypothetical protein
LEALAVVQIMLDVVVAATDLVLVVIALHRAVWVLIVHNNTLEVGVVMDLVVV